MIANFLEKAQPLVCKIFNLITKCMYRALQGALLLRLMEIYREAVYVSIHLF